MSIKLTSLTWTITAVARKVVDGALSASRAITQVNFDDASGGVAL